MSSFSPAAIATIALWKSAPMGCQKTAAAVDSSSKKSIGPNAFCRNRAWVKSTPAIGL